MSMQDAGKPVVPPSHTTVGDHTHFEACHATPSYSSGVRRFLHVSDSSVGGSWLQLSDDPCMAEDASESLRSFREFVSSFFGRFDRKSQLLFYLILSVSKMPFIPPVSIVSGLSGKEKTINRPSSTTTVTKTTVPREDKDKSVKGQLASNLKQLAKKRQPGTELHSKRRERLPFSSQTDSLPASSSGESLSKTQQHRRTSRSSVKREPELENKTRNQEEARFTLTLTPEAVLLLQRRNCERHHRPAARNNGSGAGVSGNTADSRRRRESLTKRNQPPSQRQSNAEPGDITSIVKISLLNEQYKYDDMEYEEEECYGVDESVVLKCTEWLHGLENTPVTVGNSRNRNRKRI